jgi:hypothetical protein
MRFAASPRASDLRPPTSLTNPAGFAASSRWLRSVSDDTTGSAGIPCPFASRRDASAAAGQPRRYDPCRDRSTSFARSRIRWCRCAQPPATRCEPFRVRKAEEKTSGQFAIIHPKGGRSHAEFFSGTRPPATRNGAIERRKNPGSFG